MRDRAENCHAAAAPSMGSSGASSGAKQSDRVVATSLDVIGLNSLFFYDRLMLTIAKQMNILDLYPYPCVATCKW